MKILILEHGKQQSRRFTDVISEIVQKVSLYGQLWRHNLPQK